MRGYNERAYAKLNLALDVGSLRADGYHEMTMIMQTASLCDDIRIERVSEGFSCVTNLRYIPGDERNLAARAAKEFCAAAGLPGGVRLFIAKRIPVGSGMGGGSADAAAVLRGLNAMNGRPFGLPALIELGGGSVPMCHFALRAVRSLPVAGGNTLAASTHACLPLCHLQAELLHLYARAV